MGPPDRGSLGEPIIREPAETDHREAVAHDPNASSMRDVAGAVLAAHAAGWDVAEWVARGLAEAAAALGSSEALLANRPGSWEAAIVRSLLAGMVGPEDEHLTAFGQAGGDDGQGGP